VRNLVAAFYYTEHLRLSMRYLYVFVFAARLFWRTKPILDTHCTGERSEYKSRVPTKSCSHVTSDAARASIHISRRAMFVLLCRPDPAETPGDAPAMRVHRKDLPAQRIHQNASRRFLPPRPAVTTKSIQPPRRSSRAVVLESARQTAPRSYREDCVSPWPSGSTGRRLRWVARYIRRRPRQFASGWGRFLSVLGTTSCSSLPRFMYCK
jgi:hypothetical protein